MRLWIDRDHDGVTDATEVHDLTDFDIEEIGLTQRVEAPWGEALIERALEDIYFGYESVPPTP